MSRAAVHRLVFFLAFLCAGCLWRPRKTLQSVVVKFRIVKVLSGGRDCFALSSVADCSSKDRESPNFLRLCPPPSVFELFFGEHVYDWESLRERHEVSLYNGFACRLAFLSSFDEVKIREFEGRMRITTVNCRLVCGLTKVWI